VAAYGVYAGVRYGGMPFAVAVIFGIILATVLGVAIDRAVYLPLRKRKSSPLVMLLASIGVYTVLQNLISLIFGDDTKSIRYWPVKEGINIFDWIPAFAGMTPAEARITPVQIIIIITSIVLLAGLVAFLRYTRLGKAIRAVPATRN